MTRSTVFRLVVLGVSFTLFVTGCASFNGATPRAVAFQSYDLPSTLDANAVIGAVERAFVRTFSKPPRVVEGKVYSPLPAMPVHFTVEDRVVYLDRLGTVSIPEVICPENMTIMQAFVADKSEFSGLHSYTGCIQAYAGGYRVSIVGSSMAVNGDDPAMRAAATGLKSVPEPLARIAEALREQLSDARLVAGAYAEESGTPVWRTDGKTIMTLASATAERPSSFASPTERAAASRTAYREDEVVSTLPLVCLAPREEPAPVRTARGEGHVVTVLDSGSIMAVAEPVDADYFRVEIENGRAGWVNRSDVQRLPCPIG